MEIKGLDLSPTVSMLDGIQESLQANQNAMIASMRLANQARAEEKASIRTKQERINK